MKVILFIIIGFIVFIVYQVLMSIIAKKLKVKCPHCGSKKVVNIGKVVFDKEWYYCCNNCFSNFKSAINNDEL